MRVFVRDALARLPQAGRETAERFYLREHTLREIADELDLPLGTVKRRLHDARHRLRDLLIHSPASLWDLHWSEPPDRSEADRT